MPTRPLRGPRKLPDAEIVRLYLSGLDSNTVGYQAQCAGTTVLDLVRAAGGTVRRPGTRPDLVLQLSEEDICARYAADESGPKIAAAAGCACGTIYKVLRKHGVLIRPDGRKGMQAARLARQKANHHG